MLTIIDYGLGNVGSIANMLTHLGIASSITGNAEDIAAAERLILPGVGAFGSGMRLLRERGLLDILKRRIGAEAVPVLGICLGLQLLCRSSEEDAVEGMGILAARSIKFKSTPGEPEIKIPHMGWNDVTFTRSSPLWPQSAEMPRFYFMHSFHLDSEQPGDVAGHTVYGYKFPSIIQRGNVCGVQFHPEKSHTFGMRILKNFAEAAF